MATRVCWQCGVKTHLTPYGIASIVQLSGTSHRNWCAFKCDNCGALSLGTNVTPAIGRANLTGWMDIQQDLEWYPEHAIGKDFPDVPQHIAEAASESYRCQSISAFRAAVQLARSVVEAVAKEKGVTQGQLAHKIDELFNRNLIREYVKDGAHEVRHLGNEMAHGDFISPVTSEEADLVLTLMSEILEEVYQSPARVAAARAARAARNAATTGP